MELQGVGKKEKVLDLRKTVYDLSKENPEIVEILRDAGFDKIAEPGMLATAGRFMTIPKGAAMRGVDLNAVKELFRERGYKIIE